MRSAIVCRIATQRGISFDVAQLRTLAFLSNAFLPVVDFGFLSNSKFSNKQESCAIAKMTVQCALHMGALKIFGTP